MILVISSSNINPPPPPPPNTHTHTYLQVPAIEDYILLAKRGRACSTYHRQLWDTLRVKLADTQLVYDFSALNRGPNSVHVIFSLFFNIPLHCKSRQFATICTYPQIVDRSRLQCCPRSNGGVSEYVLGWRCLQTHTHKPQVNKQSGTNHMHTQDTHTYAAKQGIIIKNYLCVKEKCLYHH